MIFIFTYNISLRCNLSLRKLCVTNLRLLREILQIFYNNFRMLCFEMASYSGIFDPDKENFLLSGEIHYFRVPKKSGVKGLQN